LKENQRTAKRSLLVEKQRDFSIQKCIDSQSEKSLSEARMTGVARSKELQNFMAAKLKANFFVLLGVALLVSQVSLSV